MAESSSGFGQTSPGFGQSSPGLGQPNRRLAAVMFLDMVGYSAMMSKDEGRALACVGELEKLLRAEVPKFGGRVVKFMGDGSMAEFPTALSSVRCSQSILEAVESNNAWVPAAQRYGVRIGLHLGELVDRDDDIFSNAVNVAARIQPLADPGGIAMSSFIYSQIESQLKLDGTYLPPQKLKNIPEKMRIFLVNPVGGKPTGRTIREHRDLATRIAIGAGLLVLAVWLAYWFFGRHS
ncbi:MAG: adenylate/guanylate cyclase domain-containing protein [Lacunisphaera sp.]|nr:adenylate/guanylate cyclase domain-containing protein [Lacunisphaera sp.]